MMLAAALLQAEALSPNAAPITIAVHNVRNGHGRVHVDVCPRDRFLADGCPWLADAPAQVAVDDDGDAVDGGVGDGEAESIDEEPLSELVERLDTTVFGLVEALDADRTDLPRFLDEALKGSLWARQIAREGEGIEALHRKIFEARANLIWSVTTAQARRGHFAMGVD